MTNRSLTQLPNWLKGALLCATASAAAASAQEKAIPPTDVLPSAFVPAGRSQTSAFAEAATTTFAEPSAGPAEGESPFRWGAVGIDPHLSYGILYSDGILVSPGQPAATTRQDIAPGIRFLLKGACDEVKWRRWSEWGVFPPEDISRTEGTARAHRDPKWGQAQWNVRPAWPWSQDETELGTADFRSIKYNIYEATLVAPYGSGFSAYANGDAHFRAALAPGGVAAHLLWRCPLGQVPLKPKDCLQGEFVVQLTR